MMNSGMGQKTSMLSLATTTAPTMQWRYINLQKKFDRAIKRNMGVT